MDAKMSPAEIEALLLEIFPQIDFAYAVTEVGGRYAVVRMEADDSTLRPGGTVSGPSMFALADLCFYVAIFAAIGPEALAVTTNATINFLRKPAPGPLTARARILKLGRSLCVGDVTLYSTHIDEPVAHAALTYARPPAAV